MGVAHIPLLMANGKTGNLGQNMKPFPGRWREQSQLETDVPKTTRLVYSWATVDHEVSLFYDDQVSYAISDFERPLPKGGNMWPAADASEWKQYMEKANLENMTLPEFF
jgi:hypothetical protein